MALFDFWSADDPPASPVAQIFKQTANDSPSPWGEGRDEGGRESVGDDVRRLILKNPQSPVRN